MYFVHVLNKFCSVLFCSVLLCMKFPNPPFVGSNVISDGLTN